MEEPTIRDVLVAIETLTTTTLHIQQDVSVLKQDVSELKQDVSVLKQDVSELKQDVSVLKQDVLVLKQDVADLGEAMQDLATHVDERFDRFEATSATKDYVDRQDVKTEERVMVTVRKLIKAH